MGIAHIALGEGPLPKLVLTLFEPYLTPEGEGGDRSTPKKFNWDHSVNEDLIETCQP